MRLVDTHAHLDIAGVDFRKQPGRIQSSSDRDLEPLLGRAREAGVDRIITVASDVEDIANVVAIAQKYDSVWAAIGVHPDDIAKFTDETLANIRKMAQENKEVVAIGEIGLDMGPHGRKQSVDRQSSVFRSQLKLAQELNLPAIVHTREADELTIGVLQDFTDLKLVVHCFQSDSDLLEAILGNPNWMLSFTGLVTFPPDKVAGILDAVKKTPLSKIMIETDTPFLAPVPHRGEINEPAYVVEVAKKIAEIKGLGLEEVAKVTTKNAEVFFGI